MVSTTLGLLINLVEQDRASRPVLAGHSLPHGKAVVPLLCRLMQVRIRCCGMIDVCHCASLIPAGAQRCLSYAWHGAEVQGYVQAMAQQVQ